MVLSELGGFLAGAVATFVADGQIGSGVLLAVGALFLLMVDHRPYDYFRQNRRQRGAAREEADPKGSRESSTPRSLTSERSSPRPCSTLRQHKWRPVTQKAQWVLFEKNLTDELQRLVPDAHIQKGRSVGNRGLDLLLEGDVVRSSEEKRWLVLGAFVAKLAKKGATRWCPVARLQYLL